jgi:hypothetical protein
VPATCLFLANFFNSISLSRCGRRCLCKPADCPNPHSLCACQPMGVPPDAPTRPCARPRGLTAPGSRADSADSRLARAAWMPLGLSP